MVVKLSGAAALKKAVKAAMTETLHEQRDLLYDVFVEVLEDFALADAIRDGLKTPRVSRDVVFRALRSGQ